MAQRYRLKDRLSHLKYRQACRILGPDGARCILEGGKIETPCDQDHMTLTDDLFQMKVEDAMVTLKLSEGSFDEIHWECNSCSALCHHVGAAFSTILEEKMTLGLAEPPPERVPVESLSEVKLVERALSERTERADKEKMVLKSLNPDQLWTDYTITNRLSGKSYRVALRGWERGESYCSCPDFRKNTLGTCKHLLFALRKVKQKFPEAKRKVRYQPRDLAVHIRYGRENILAFLVPTKLDPMVEKIVAPYKDRPITDIYALMHTLKRLESLGHSVTVYPDAEERIQQNLFKLHMKSKIDEIRKNPSAHPLRKELLKTELLPYQLDGIAFAVGAGRAILADDMGLGKTIQGIGVAELLRREKQIHKVLIICPTSLKSQWHSEIKRFSKLHSQMVVGSAKQREPQYGNSSFFTICNYEQILRDILLVEQVSWDLIILDEGQRIKNWEAKTSRIIKGLRSPYALVLTGTPLENRLDELFSIVEFVDPTYLGPDFRFYNQHRVVDEKGKVLGYKNLDQLRKRLAPIMLRRTRASVVKELPERTTQIVRIEPTDEQLELHREHMKIVSAIVRKPYISEMDLLKMQKHLLMCRLTANSTALVFKQKIGYSSKLQTLDELLGRLASEGDRKIILFSEWTRMLDLIEPILNKYKMNFVRLDGKVPQKRRQDLVNQFQKDPKCRLFITTNAGSTGLNLQAANTVINVDLPWNPAILEQRIARAHRMGQKNPIQVYVLVTEKTIEDNLLHTLSAKNQLALAALDINSNVNEVSLSCGMEELKRRLEILIGEHPEAPLDVSKQNEVQRSAKEFADKESISRASGQLLSAAFDFVSALLPQPETCSSPSVNAFKTEFADRLLACTETTPQGDLRLTVTLPDRQFVERLASTLAQLVPTAQASTAQQI